MSLLRLTHLVEQTLLSEDQRSAIELLIEHPNLLEDLRSASLGDYHVVLNIMACLERGNLCKGLVDHVIDKTDHIVNIRETILENRLRSSLTRVDEDTRQSYLSEALKSLERYAFAVCFAGYLDECTDLNRTFFEWLQQRKEISNMIQFLRHKGGKLFHFAPVADLSDLSKRTSTNVIIRNADQSTISPAGTVLADEYAELVVHRRNGILLRSSTLLKSDNWRQTDRHVALPGAVNFRRVSNTNIYALGQPDLSAIDQLVQMIKDMHPKMKKISWINLREEPISYVNQEPYCLRKEGYSFRNLKDFGGISSSRLEVLEDRLKNDVISEVTKLEGKLLLHTETTDGKVMPIWEDVNKDDIASLKDIMGLRSDNIDFKRIPITPEAVPDFTDIHDLMNVIIQTDSQSPIVVNCQLGRGRSTLASVLIILVQNWRRKSQHDPHAGLKRQLTIQVRNKSSERKSYQVINNLLRVIRRGLEVKNTVDDAIDEAGDIYNLREAVDDARIRAVEETDEIRKRQYIQKGLIALRRYFWLIVFQSYLQETKPDTIENLNTIKSYVEFRPVLYTFENEIKSGGLESLQALTRDTNPPEGNALSDEVERVVRNRNGRILSAQTLLKSDFFSQLQKMSLPERVEGAANFRRIPLSLAQNIEYYRNINDENVKITETDKIIVGVGMPSGIGLRNALDAMSASPSNQINKVYWTSLREEPVIYIVGHPHVLRLANKPLTNVESTGVSTEVVEAMEDTLKRDVIQAAKDTGRVLLHDEQEISPGNYKIIPIWMNAEESDILTPREMFETVQREGYKVDYSRVAITDEQAPLPNALAQLQNRCVSALESSSSMAFNCQMGRGRTTTGMVVGCLVSAIYHKSGDPMQALNDLAKSRDDHKVEEEEDDDDDDDDSSNPYLNGEYRTILELVGVLKHGKRAKIFADRAIDLMEGVQNLRKTIYNCKLQAQAAESNTPKAQRVSHIHIFIFELYLTILLLLDVSYSVKLFT